MATAEEIALGQRIRDLITAAGGSTTPGGVGVPATQLDADGTVLDVNVIADGEFLKRVGATVVSAVPAAAAHHLTHENGGADEINVAGLSGLLGDPQTPAAHTHVIGDLPAALITDVELATELANYPDFVDFNDHSARHENGGADEINVAGLNGVLADPQPPIIGAGAAQAVAGNDPRLGDARTPLAHAATHQPGGSDAMAVDQAPAVASLRTLGVGGAQAAAGNDPRFTDARTPVAHAASHAAGGGDAVLLTEAQVTNLVADLAARAMAGVLRGSYDPGSAIVPDESYLFAYKRLVLSGAERLTMQGSGNALISDFGMRGATRVVGSPKTVAGSFIVPHDYYYLQEQRLVLCGEARANLLGTANLILSDDFGTRNRITLVGRG